MLTKYSYFKMAHRLGLTATRRWILLAYTPPIPTREQHSDMPGNFYYNDDLTITVILEDGTKDTISDVVPNTPLYGIKEAVTVKKDDFLITDKAYKTFYSNLLLNLVLLEIPFKGKVPFHNSPFSIQMLDDLISKGLKDKTITVKEYQYFTKAIGLLSCLASISIPSASYRAVTPPSDIVERRDALLEKYKDQLDDPVIVNKIEDELIAYYKEYMKGDISEGYFLKGKDFAVTLKRAEIMFGAEPRLDDNTKTDLIIPSLREGWDMEKLPQMVNSLRMGSYNRGSETALGGEAAKFSARVYQNTVLVENDCGSVVGVPFAITAYNWESFTGRYRIVKGKPVEILLGDLKESIGRRVVIRSPQTCWTDRGNYCPICMGKEVSESGKGLGIMASRVGSVFLGISLALFHSSKLSVQRYDYKSSIT